MAAAPLIPKWLDYYKYGILFIVIVLVYVSNATYAGNVDTVPASHLPFKLLAGQGFTFDNESAFYSENNTHSAYYVYYPIREGHNYSAYPIVEPVVLTPFYALPFAYLSLSHIPVDVNDIAYRVVVLSSEKAYAAFLTGVCVVFFLLFLEELMDWRFALFGAIAYGFGTEAWSIASQALWQHTLSCMLMAVMLLVVVRHNRTNARWLLVVLGACIGLYAYNRPFCIPLLLPFVVYVVLCGWDFLYAAATGVVAGAPFQYYNLAVFGGLFGNYGGAGNALDLFVPRSNFFENIAGSLVSPSKGVFVVSPIVLLAVPGFLEARSFKGRLKSFFTAAVVGCLVFFYVAGGVVHLGCDGGGYGPRYMTDLMPLLVCFAALFLWHHRDDKRIIALGLLLLVLSIGMQVVGAYMYPSGGFTWENTARLDHAAYWSVSDSQATRSLDFFLNHKTFIRPSYP